MFKYLYRLRPPGPGCQPKNFIECQDCEINKNNRKYWGYVIYQKELSTNEIDDYDLEIA